MAGGRAALPVGDVDGRLLRKETKALQETADTELKRPACGQVRSLASWAADLPDIDLEKVWRFCRACIPDRFIPPSFRLLYVVVLLGRVIGIGFAELLDRFTRLAKDLVRARPFTLQLASPIVVRYGRRSASLANHMEPGARGLPVMWDHRACHL